MVDLSYFKNYADLLSQINNARQTRITANDPFGQGAPDGFDPNNFSTKIGNNYFSADYSLDGSTLNALSTGTNADSQNFRLSANPDGSIAEAGFSPSTDYKSARSPPWLGPQGFGRGPYGSHARCLGFGSSNSSGALGGLGRMVNLIES